MKNCQECNKNILKYYLWLATTNNLIKFHVVVIAADSTVDGGGAVLMFVIEM